MKYFEMIFEGMFERGCFNICNGFSFQWISLIVGIIPCFCIFNSVLQLEFQFNVIVSRSGANKPSMTVNQENSCCLSIEISFDCIFFWRITFFSSYKSLLEWLSRSIIGKWFVTNQLLSEGDFLCNDVIDISLHIFYL